MSARPDDGGPACDVAGGDGKGVGDPAKRHATLAPHVGKVFLDTNEDGSFNLSNVETGETLTLEPGVPWDLHYDDGGFAYIFDTSMVDPEPIEVESRFKFNVYEAAEQRLMMVWGRSPGSTSRVWLDELRAEFLETSGKFFIGATRSEMNVSMFALKFPRKSAKLFVALKDLYSGMKLSQFGGHSWMWIDGSKKRWLKTFADYGFPEHFVGSTRSKMQLDAEDCFLPAQAISLQGMVALLCRWAWSSPRYGGFQDREHRNAALDVMQGFLRALLPLDEEQELYWPIDLVRDWSPQHPRPQQFTNKVILRIMSNGQLDLANFRLKADLGGAFSFPAIVLAVITNNGSQEEVFFWDLLQKSLEDPLLLGIHKQLVWRAGVRVQGLALDVMRGEKKMPDKLFVRETEWSDVFEIRSQLDPRLVRYCIAAKRISRGHNVIGLCADKAACGGFNLQAGVLSLPDNTGIVPPPQVTTGFDCTVHSASSKKEAGDAKKRIVGRQVAWVRRGIGGNFVTWKMQKRFRVAAKHVIQNIDNQVQQITELKGLKAFQYDSESRLWDAAGWAHWPHLTLAMDQGSDGVAAAWYLLAENTNVTFYWDYSHGCQNDWKLVVRDMALYSFWVLMLVTWNCPCGPMNDRVRWQELAEAWDRMFINLEPTECALYTEKVDEILRQRGGLPSLGGEGEDIQLRLWEDLRADPPFVVGQRKTNIARFFNSTERAKTELDRWDTVLLNMEYLALETGLLAGRRLNKLNFKEATAENDEVARDADRPGRPQVDERLLRTSCQNAVEVGVYMLTEPEHKFWVNIVLAAGGPTEEWHRLQSHTLRSVKASQQWVIQQLEGHFEVHLHRTWDQLKLEPTLKKCGLQCRGLKADANLVEVVAQDDLADLLGTGVLSMVFRRQQRCVWMMRGWPVRMTGLLGPAPLRLKIAASFREDWRAYCDLRAQAAQSGEMQALLTRSVFTQRSVLQYVEAMEETNFTVSDELRKLVEKRSLSVISSQCSEDLFNSAKNSRLTKGKANYRRPDKAYSAMLTQHIVDKRHKYSEVVPDSALPFQAVSLGKEVFQPRKESCTLQLDTLATTKSKTDWYSSTAVDWGRIHADLEVMRHLQREDEYDKLSNLFLSRLFNCKHKMLVQKTEGGQWYFVGVNWGDSAALVWPAVRKTIQGYDNAMVFEPSMRENTAFEMVTILSLDGWRAVPYRWRSPLWQYINWPGARASLIPAVRAVTNGQDAVRSLMVVAAQAGFWELDLTFVKGTSLCDTLASVISNIVGCSEADALGYMKHRVARMSAANRLMSEFLEIDDINDVIDHHDKEAIDQHRKTAAAKVAVEKAFAEEYGKKVRSVRPVAKPPAKKQRRGSATNSATAPNTVPLATGLTQSQAKEYVPPGASIWVDKFAGSWQGHLPPFSRVSRSFRKWTEQGAFKEVLRELWRAYCLSEGIPEEECAMRCLFVAPEGGASSSSSSAAAR